MIYQHFIYAKLIFNVFLYPASEISMKIKPYINKICSCLSACLLLLTLKNVGGTQFKNQHWYIVHEPPVSEVLPLMAILVTVVHIDIIFGSYLMLPF